VIRPHVVFPLESIPGTVRHVAAAAGQLQHRRGHRLFFDGVFLEEMFQNSLHVAREVTANPEAFAPQNVRRLAQFAVDSVEATGD